MNHISEATNNTMETTTTNNNMTTLTVKSLLGQEPKQAKELEPAPGGSNYQ